MHAIAWPVGCPHSTSLEAMTDPYMKLLAEARQVLERYLFDGVDLRDDVAEVCAKIEQALSAPAADPAQAPARNSAADA